MNAVNLLPWRDQKRAMLKRQFIALCIAVGLVALAITVLIGHYLSQQISQQQQRNLLLSHKVKQYQQDIIMLSSAMREHQNLEARLAEVEQLQQRRHQTTAFMNLLPTLIPSGVYLDKVKMEGQHFKLQGFSERTSHLAELLKRLEDSPRTHNVRMHSIVHGKQRFERDVQVFEASFMLRDGTLDSTTATEQDIEVVDGSV
ncbi:PilN domain-containing protein [Vibrio sp. ZSDZ34]|jgi:type IV pilus assembly protein PilN|uniref:PilN domain-containing protein n=1 Tax=Vibrio gelatinilyticus TaxID=2893468 RepID=A0A9X1WEW3_9VIBR|nr:PilN domain-containing protein [Vibrio gelatinilyticus]MCJ2378786.1 PilN domain-containing protein [Vibrio gelatinilyticus]